MWAVFIFPVCFAVLSKLSKILLLESEKKIWLVKNKRVCHAALGSSGAIMEMRYTLRYCTPKRAWVWVGAREKTCLLLNATENRDGRAAKWAFERIELTGPNPKESFGLSNWEMRNQGGEKGHKTVSQ